MITCLMALLLIAAPGATDDPSTVAIHNVRTVFDRQGDKVEISQFISVSVPKGVAFSSPSGWKIELPPGVFDARPMTESESGLEFGARSVSYMLPINDQGARISIIYYLPINDAGVQFEQQFPSTIHMASALSFWTLDNADIKGKGFTKAEKQEMESGMNALMIASRNIDDGKLSIKLTNLTADGDALKAKLSFLLCLVLMSFGLIVWIRDKRQ